MKKFAEFAAADCLDHEKVIAEYPRATLDDENPNVFHATVRDVAKARGMAQPARSWARKPVYGTGSRRKKPV